jgi:hypothetical protein
MKRERKNPEAKYFEHTRRQREALEEYAKREEESAGDLLLWYTLRKEEMPADEYRAAAFFTNREYVQKPGSLTLCYVACKGMEREQLALTRENALRLLAWRFKMYCAVLEKGGYGGAWV